MSPRDVRRVAVWLRQQAAAQDAREGAARIERMRMRERVARQARDGRGRWTEARA